MSQSDSQDVMLAFLIGGALGVIAGVLMAPRTGRQTRRQVGRWLEDVGERTEDVMDRGNEYLHEKSDRIKDSVKRVRDRFE